MAGPWRAAATSAARWGDLRTRVLSAAIMVPLALGCVWIGGMAFAGLVALTTIGMAHEWLRLCRAPSGPRPVLMFASLPLAVFLAALGEAGFAVALLALITLLGCIRRGAQGNDRAIRRLLPFGVPYIGLGAVALIWLRGLPGDGRNAVIVLLLVIWATDVGAYVAGRAIGGRRIAPGISPGKTWSGSVGGLFAGMAVGFLAAGLLNAADVRWLSALLAGLIGCVGQAGDLFESALKRRFNVKDSGSMIPGHGGLLDRLDAVLAAAPATVLLAFALGRGVIAWQ
ncbi:phosphatidate cytidylyltransferase [Rhodopila sp.]|uniref:phosphatidate cytidylyltransferase n=1 Tax=Rhodopila sp. TaxID=2480087 RepID=UPI003D0CAA82